MTGRPPWDGNGGNGAMMYGGNMFGMGWMWIFWILLVLGTALLVFVLVKLATRNDAPRPPDPNVPRTGHP